MAGQLIPLPEHDPQPERRTTPSERLDAWLDLCRAADAMLIAGIKHRVGSDGDWVAEYRRCYEDWVQEHDAMIRRLSRRLAESEASHDHT